MMTGEHYEEHLAQLGRHAVALATRHLRNEAQRFAYATWAYIAVGGVVWCFANWKWALILFALATLSAIESVRATAKANKLEKC